MVEPVPPVAAVYHFKEVPVAESAFATSPIPYVIGEVTVGTEVAQVVPVPGTKRIVFT